MKKILVMLLCGVLMLSFSANATTKPVITIEKQATEMKDEFKKKRIFHMIVIIRTGQHTFDFVLVEWFYDEDTHQQTVVFTNVEPFSNPDVPTVDMPEELISGSNINIYQTAANWTVANCENEALVTYEDY